MKFALIALFVAPISTNASAASLFLGMNTSGVIAPSPEWQDASSEPIAQISFSFERNVAGDARANVDSIATTVKLVHAASGYPANVAVVRPSGCQIGSTAVNNDHVHFLSNGTAVTSDADLSIPSSGNQSYSLRFAATGSYGDKVGAITCTSAGTLTYTY